MKLLGADKIGHYEHVVVENIKGGVNKVWPGAFEESNEDEEEGQGSETQAVEKKRGPAEEASMFMSFFYQVLPFDRVVFRSTVLTIHITRPMDPVGSCLCHPQKLHFRARASNSSYHAQGC